MKRKRFFGVVALSAAMFSTANSANVTIQNIRAADDGAYGLFDSGGTLIPDTLTSNIRVGYFSASESDVLNAWNSGDLSTLNSSFVDFGTSGMTAFDDGVFQDSIPGSIGTGSSFIGENITLYASNSEDFLNSNGEFLVYSFDQTFAEDDPNFDFTAILGESSGDLLFGGFSNYSNDFGLGSGSLPGFNTVSVVPEPSAYAAIAGALALCWVMVRRRQ